MENNNLYSEIISIKNLFLAYKKARKGKTKKKYVIEFQSNLRENLIKLNKELKNQTYSPEPLVVFILRDPKTRKISKSAFPDRIVHHALHRVIEPVFDKSFIFDSCANRKGKGNLFAINIFYQFFGKVTQNNTHKAYCLKADIKHYFEEVSHEILISILEKKIKDNKVIWLIKQILNNTPNSFKGRQTSFCKGMPLGNLTSQFFANVYLNELDYFVKHFLKAKYYIRYVDDFVILHNSKEKLEIWKAEIDKFLRENLKLELHSQKSKIIHLSRGIDFVGFRNYWHYKLLRKKNIRKILFRIEQYKEGKISKEKLLESFKGWNAYAKWANSYGVRREIVRKIYSAKLNSPMHVFRKIRDLSQKPLPRIELGTFVLRGQCSTN